MERETDEPVEASARRLLGMSYAEVCEELDKARRSQVRQILLRAWRATAPQREAEDARHHAAAAPSDG